MNKTELIKRHTTDKIKENSSGRIIRVALKIKSNVENGGKI